MRILILSFSAGEGHNSCAKAIKSVADAKGVPCDIVDTLQFVSSGAGRLMSVLHAGLYRHFPKFTDDAYQYAQEHPQLFQTRSGGTAKLLSGVLRKLRAYLKAGGYDAVICVHLFPAILLTLLLKEQPLSLRTCFVATDYTASPSCDQVGLDRLFIPDDSLKGEFSALGIPEEKLVGSGIPVRQVFYHRQDKAAAKADAGIVPEHRHLLIMSGSMGAGPIQQIVEDLTHMIGPDCELTAVCGTNKQLYQRLSQKLGGRQNVHILGFVQDIPLLMDSADLYLTKPGGISVSEAWVKALPMVLVNAVAGCEGPNLDFFTRLGGAVTAESLETIAELCLTTLSDPEKLAAMSAALAPGSGRNAAETIFRFAAGEPVPV